MRLGPSCGFLEAYDAFVGSVLLYVAAPVRRGVGVDGECLTELMGFCIECTDTSMAERSVPGVGTQARLHRLLQHLDPISFWSGVGTKCMCSCIRWMRINHHRER